MDRKISRKMIYIGFPVMLQMLVQNIFSFTDMAFVGNYKIEGLSALTNAIAPYFISLSFYWSISQGLTIIISNSIGANNKKKAEKYGENALFFNQILSFIYLLFWLMGGKFILSLMGITGEILRLGSIYLGILSFSFLTFGLGITSGAIIQGLGRTLPVFIVIFIKTIFNIFLNWILIFGKFGFPELGIAGSALGSTISNIVGDISLFFILLSQKDFKINIKKIFKPNIVLFKDMLLLGLPMGIEGILWQSGQAGLLFILNRINQMYSGYAGVISNIINISLAFYWGAAISVLIMVSEYRGRKEKENIRKVNKYGLIYSMIICIIFSIFILTFPDKLFRIFITEKEKIESLIHLVPYMILIMFPKAMNVINGQSIKGLGDTKWAMNTQIFGTAYILLLGYIFIFVLRLGIVGGLLAVALDEITRGVFNFYRFHIKEART